MCEWGYRLVATLGKQEWDSLPTTSLGTKTWQTLSWGEGEGEEGAETTFIHQLQSDTGLSVLWGMISPSVMTNRREWDRLIK